MQSDQNTNFVENIQEDDETQEKYEKRNVCDTNEEELREEKKPSYIHIIFFYRILNYSTPVPFHISSVLVPECY